MKQPIKVVVAAAAGLCLALFSAPAAAALHGYCAGTEFGECVDNGTTSPAAENPPVDFGFSTDSGSRVGDLFIDVLAPTSTTKNPTALNIVFTGTLSGTATLFSTTPWTSGNLDSYLGPPFMGAEPTNPIGAFAPLVPTKGFFVYQVDLGTFDFGLQTMIENISSGPLPARSYLVAFFNKGTAANPNVEATQSSGAIFLPEPASLLLLGTSLLGLGVSWRRRRT